MTRTSFIAKRGEQLASRIHELDGTKGTESVRIGVGPIRLSGAEWQSLLAIANDIVWPEEAVEFRKRAGGRRRRTP